MYERSSRFGLPLVDEFLLMIHPVVLGEGRRFFGDKTPLTNFKLADVVTTDAGVMLTTYRQK